jgi:hypothetical protein
VEVERDVWASRSFFCVCESGRLALEHQLGTIAKIHFREKPMPISTLHSISKSPRWTRLKPNFNLKTMNHVMRQLSCLI